MGYGSLQNTLECARKLDTVITLEDIKKRTEEKMEQQPKGCISLLAHKSPEEFQVDLFFMPDHKYKLGMVMVDIFTKYTAVTPYHG